MKQVARQKLLNTNGTYSSNRHISFINLLVLSSCHFFFDTKKRKSQVFKLLRNDNVLAKAKF